MDSARNFRPTDILLWKQVAEHAGARRIVGLFPSARVRLIERQRIPSPAGSCPARALVHGKRTLMIGETSSFVGSFGGQPGPDVHCPRYLKLVPVSNGCPYYCTYCYLAFVYRNHSPCIKININHDTMFRQIRKALAGADRPVCFSMGEMLDSLALDHITGLAAQLVPFFEHLRRGYLIFLTKSTNIDALLNLRPHDHVVVSWSMNSASNIRDFELGTPSLDERIEAARRCREHGYRVRIRIDPGILSHDWMQGYAELIEKVMSSAQPENITLGTLRLLPGHSRLARAAYRSKAGPLCAQRLSEKASDGKYRYSTLERLRFYRHLISVIRAHHATVPVGLCRETPDVWRELAGTCAPAKCNCLVW